MPLSAQGSRAQFIGILWAWVLSAAVVAASESTMKSPETVVRPTDTVYERLPFGNYDRVLIIARTVEEAAQVYADFSRKEILVPTELLERRLRYGPDKASPSIPGNMAYNWVIQGLTWILSADGVEITSSGADTVLFREGKPASERSQRRNATQAEIARYADSMPEARFWELIDQARKAGGNRCQPVANALTQALSRLSEDEMLGFELRFEERMSQSYRWDLWAVAYIANGGASDDGFTYFRAWLIGQGRERFEAALKHAPDAVEGYSGSFLGRLFGSPAFECEALLYPSMEVYQRKTGQLPPMGLVTYPTEPAGVPWREEDLPKLYPELYKRFR
jgi:hypothetical protein